MTGFLSKEEEIHERKHLKAYRQGKRYFQNGWIEEKDEYTSTIKRYPKMFEVQQLLDSKPIK